MWFVKTSTRKPVSATVGVLLIVLFGLFGLLSIPIQLTLTVSHNLLTKQAIV